MDNTLFFESLSPNVVVDDVNKTVAYYTGILGFNLVASVPENGVFNWAMAARDGVTIMFQSLKSLQEDMPSLGMPSKGGIGTFFIKMKGVDTLYQSLKGKIDMASDLRTTFYGMREFTIRDLNGYLLTFAEEVHP